MTQKLLIKCIYKVLLRNKNDKYVYEVIDNNYNSTYITSTIIEVYISCIYLLYLVH